MALTNHFMSRCESDLRAVQHGPITTLPFWAFPPYDLAAPSGAAFFWLAAGLKAPDVPHVSCGLGACDRLAQAGLTPLGCLLWRG